MSPATNTILLLTILLKSTAKLQINFTDEIRLNHSVEAFWFISSSTNIFDYLFLFN